MNKLISIVIVNYNGKKWLEKCFNSLVCQTHRDFEIIFVDNGSNDDSVDFVKNHYAENLDIRIVCNAKNLGFAGGNNSGISHASGELILLLNNDTWVESNFLEKLVSFYRQSGLDVVAPYEKAYAEGLGAVLPASYATSIDFLGHPIYLYGRQSGNFYLSGVCLLFSKRLYSETMGLDDDFFMYFEEIDWFWRLLLLEKKFSYVDGLYVHHAGSGATGMGIKYSLFLWRNQNTLQMLLKNYKALTLFWVLPIYFLQNAIEIIFFMIVAKPKIAFSYLCGWWFNAVNFKRTRAKRIWVQKNRKIGDREIMRNMHPGFAKATHITRFIRRYAYGKSL